MDEVVMTPHAGRRAQQCAVTPALIATVLHRADLELPIGQRRVALRLSAGEAASLRHEQGAAIADRAASVVLILTDGVVATVLRAIGRPSRHYLRRRR